jgi:aconitate hydratase
MNSHDSFRTLRPLSADCDFFSLPALGTRLGVSLDRLPFSLKVLLENLLRHEDGSTVTGADIEALARWPGASALEREVSFHPARVLMPDSSGIPLLIDLAAMRDAMVARGLDPARVKPGIQTDLVIDHSVRADYSGTSDAFVRNLKAEIERNQERYAVVRWAMSQFDTLRVVPPGNGIVHQINLEYFATAVTKKTYDGRTIAFPDSLVGMDSHTPMVNALGVFGWGVGGIEATTAMFGQPVSLQVPPVVGCRLTGARRPGVVCTDIVLTLTQFLRASGVLAAVVEFFGPGLDNLSLPDRATIANMAAEYGATMGFFPIDRETLRYLTQTARPAEHVALVETYARAQGLWREAGLPEPAFQRVLEFDLGTVEPSLAGPSRPEDRVALSDVPANFRRSFHATAGDAPAAPVAESERDLRHGDIVVSAINSCTNTSNPFQIIAAGLLARKAVARGLRTRPWIKTSFSPGSRVVTLMLQKAGLMDDLAALGFDLVGYGCMTCGSGAGPLDPPVAEAITRDKLVVLGMLSSNRNFEGRLTPAVRGTYLASPPLVVAYSIAGTVLHDLSAAPLGIDRDGNPVHLADIWPSDAEIEQTLAGALSQDLFRSAYREWADIGPEWAQLAHGTAPQFKWDPASLYLKRPPFVETGAEAAAALGSITGARVLLMLGDNITTDHISPGGAIPPETESGKYLLANGVSQARFGTYVGRRANHEVMVRGTFANVRIRNEMVPGQEGGFTRHMPDGEVMSVFQAAETYRAAGTPVIVIAGANYGCGSSRDWAAKGASLLGVRVVIAESFERIHRSNLIGMGVIALQFPPGVTRRSLGLTGEERFDFEGLSADLTPGMTITAHIHRPDGRTDKVPLLCRVDTRREAEWVRHGGILPFVLDELVVEPDRGRPVTVA